MSEEQVSSGNDAETSGQGETQSNSEHTGTVKYESFQKVLNEKKNVAERLKATEARLAEYERQNKESEERKLKEQGEYKKLLEQRDRELEEIRGSKSELERTILDSMKYQAVLDKIGGKLKHRDYMSHIDVDRVSFDPETKALDFNTVESVANDFLKTHSHLVSFPNAKLPQDAPQAAESISYEQWLKLPAREMKQKMAQVKKK